MSLIRIARAELFFFPQCNAFRIWTMVLNNSADAAAGESAVENMVRIAAAQIETVIADPKANLEKMQAWMERAVHENVEVLVFPECGLTGYDLSREEAALLAQRIPGPATEELGEACRRTGLLIVFGMIERGESGVLHNTAVLLGSGGVIGRYRKTHLPTLGVDRFLTPGSCFEAPFETSLGRFGLLICYDLRFPEPARVLALAGAQAILLPTSWPQEAAFYPDFMVASRAAENRVFVVAADRVGNERGTVSLGRSQICGVNGQVLAEGGPKEEALLIADCDLGQSEVKDLVLDPGAYELHLLDDRRPELYDLICSSEDTAVSF
jgi:5-aminopentanamidase